MMKKINLFITIIIISIFSIIPVNASTNTKERTESDLLVPNYITVTDSNKDKILNTPAVDETEKVYDFADLFTDEEEQKLYNEITDYINTYGMDLAVVTIQTNNKGTAENYADDFYDYNNFGKNSSNDGILFLIDMETREIWMSTTGTAIKMYNDYRIENALDRVYQYMTDKEYYTGCSKYIDKISEYAKSGLPTDSSEMTVSKMITYSIFAGLVGTIIIMVVLVLKNRLVRKATTAIEYLNKDSVDIKNLGDVLISSHTTKTKIEHSSSGGSSTHHGSSGISHGGGGHKF